MTVNKTIKPGLLVLLIFLLSPAPLTAVARQLQDKGAYEKGVTFYKNGKYKEAIDAFKQAAERDPRNPDVYYQLGNSYLEANELKEAIAAYNEALKLDPKMALPLKGLGITYGMLSDPQKAVDYLKQYLALKQDDARAYYNLGVAYSDLGQTSNAESAFRKASKLDPKDEDTFFNLGAACVQLGKLKDAEDALVRAVDLKPDDPQARYQLVRVYLAEGNRSFALIHYLVLQKSSPDLAAELKDEVLPENKAWSLMGNRVTVSTPSSWQVQQQEDTKTLSRIQMFIPYPATDNTPYSANAGITASSVPVGVTVKETGDRVYGYKFDGMAVVNDIRDGQNWRTFVWTAKDGVPYLSLDRFGVAGGVAVEFLVSFPLLEKGDTEWVRKVVADFNRICESLKIDGKNSANALVHLEKLPGK